MKTKNLAMKTKKNAMVAMVGRWERTAPARPRKDKADKPLKTYRFYWDVEAASLREARREFRNGVEHVCVEDGNPLDTTFLHMVVYQLHRRHHDKSVLYLLT